MRVNGGNVIFNAKNNGNLYFNSDVNSDVFIQSNDGTTLREIANFSKSGQVGIGTGTSFIYPDTKMKVYDSEFPLLSVEGPTGSTGNASIHMAVATNDAYYSNSALKGDVVLSTGLGTTENLLIQAKKAGKSIKFVTTHSGNNFQGVKMEIRHDGKVGIGTNNFVGNHLLYVGGKVVCEELRVKLQANWPDYVFSKDYKLMSLDSVETFINENHHLPNIPTAVEIKENGIETGEMLKLQMQKIEELTLYMIELKKENEQLKATTEELRKSIQLLQENE